MCCHLLPTNLVISVNDSDSPFKSSRTSILGVRQSYRVMQATLLLENRRYAERDLAGEFWSGLGCLAYFRLPLSCIEELPLVPSDLGAATPLLSFKSL